MSETSKNSRPLSKKSVTVNEARNLVVAALGDNSPIYFKHLQEWFKLRTNKETIDNVARRCLKNEQQMEVHDTFILALLNKVAELKEESHDEATQIVFPGDLVCPRMSKYYQPLARNGKTLLLKTVPDNPAVNVAQHASLASPALIHGRLLLGSWRHGMDGVRPDTAELMLEATKTFLKNILTAVINDIIPFKRHPGSHMFYVESDTSVLTKALWYKERDSFDMNSRIQSEDDISMDQGPNPLGSQLPQAPDTILRAYNVFDSLVRNPNIIPPDPLMSRILERASIYMKQIPDDVREDSHTKKPGQQ